jgi:hypothetical protein
MHNIINRGGGGCFLPLVRAVVDLRFQQVNIWLVLFVLVGVVESISETNDGREREREKKTNKLLN